MHCTATATLYSQYGSSVPDLERHSKSKIDLQRSNFYSRHQLIKVHRIPAIALAHPA